ncbi:MAG: phosphatase PAP2 family protein [Pseudomonadota bacterium]
MTNIDTPLTRSGNPFLAFFLIALWFAVLALFASYAHWDLAISSWFFEDDLCAQTANDRGFCHGFTAATDPVLRTIREILQALPPWTGVGLLFWAIADWRTGLRWQNAGFRLKTAIVATLVIWPLLIVNGILKTFWGRPRPWQSEPFGGQAPFIEAGKISDYCAFNCSFVSGEAASAGWLALLVLLFPPAHRRLAAFIMIPISLFMAGLRVAFGAHYASDIILGYIGAIAVFALIMALLTRFAAKA